MVWGKRKGPTGEEVKGSADHQPSYEQRPGTTRMNLDNTAERMVQSGRACII